MMSEAGRNLDGNRIYFSDLSMEAQKEILDFKSLKSAENNWDLLTLEHTVVNKVDMSQIEIDYAGKMYFGMYRLENLVA